MLVLGPDGSNAELKKKALVLRDGRSVERTVKLTEVLKAEVVKVKTLKIYFVDLKEPKLRVKEWTLSVIDGDVAHDFVDKLMSRLENEFPDRPKRILAFINPGCGNFKGLSIFKEEVQPVFDLCGISTEVIVTTHHSQARTTLWSRRLDDIDAILVVGGDGTFCDAAQGLLERAQVDAGISAGIDPRLAGAVRVGDDEEVERNRHVGCALLPAPSTDWTEVAFVSPSLPMIHIPGGSGNAYAMVAAGVHDYTTNALHAALGHVMRTDVASFAELSPASGSTDDPRKTPSTFVGFSCLIGGVTNLELTNTIKFDMKMRQWLGPFRYFLYPFFMLFVKQEKIRLKVRFLEEPDDGAAPLVCRVGCLRCAKKNEAAVEREWKEATVEELNMALFCLSSLRHRFTQFGLLPFAHVGDGILTFITGNAPKIASNLHYSGSRIDDYIIMDSTPYSIATPEMVIEAEQVQDIKHYVMMEETWQEMKGPVHVRVHRQLLKTYGMGMRDLSGAPTRPSIGVARFLLGKAFKVAFVVAVVVVAYKKGEWKKWAEWAGAAAKERSVCLAGALAVLR